MNFFCNCAFQARTKKNKRVSGFLNLAFQADCPETAYSHLRVSIIKHFVLNHDNLPEVKVFIDSVKSFKELPEDPYFMNIQIIDCSLSDVLYAASEVPYNNNFYYYSLRYKKRDEIMLRKPIPIVTIEKSMVSIDPDTELVKD